jgi:hypothetical protein
LVSVAVAVASRDVSTSALVDLSWAVADTASVKRTHAVVDVVADAVGVFVSGAIATTHAQGVFLVAVTVAVASGDATSATHTALVKLVAIAIAVSSRDAITTANSTFVFLKARTVILRCRSVVIASRGIRAAGNVSASTKGASTFEGNTHLLLVSTHAEWEDLEVDLS